MSIPDQKLFATSAACAAAFPIPAIQLAAAFGELARLNLSMYGVVLAGVRENRETIPSLTAADSLSWSQTEALPSLGVPFTAYAVALTDLMLQTVATLNRLALDGCVAMGRHATAAIAAMGESARIADAATKAASQVPDDSRCSTVATPVAPGIAREIADPSAESAPRASRRRSPSPRSRASS